MRDKLTAEKEVPGLNVTEQLTWGTTDCSVVAASFSAVFIQAKVQKSHASMATLAISLASFPDSSALADKGNGRRGEQD